MATEKKSSKTAATTAKKPEPTTLTGKKLGTWKVKRQGDNQLVLTIPEGLTLQGDQIAIEDVLGAISNYMIVKKGRALACCSGNIAIA